MKDHPRNPLAARAKELGIVLVERDRIPSSRRAHECTEFARSEGKLEPFHARLLTAYWTEGKDIHAWDVLAEAAGVAGLDAAAMQASVESGAQKKVVDELVEAAHDIGIHAVPTFVIGEKFMIQGAQTLDVFEKVLQRL
jgi:predicted DsbA family dithiol-disulfide isomerase